MRKIRKFIEVLMILPDNYRLFRTVFYKKDSYERAIPTRWSALRAAWACQDYRPSPFGIMGYTAYLKFSKDANG